MDLAYPPEAEAFRQEIRAWPEANLPDGWFDGTREMTPQGRTSFHETGDTRG